MLYVSWYCKHNGECERDLVDTEVESKKLIKKCNVCKVCLKMERLYLWLEMRRTMGRGKREFGGAPTPPLLVCDTKNNY